MSQTLATLSITSIEQMYAKEMGEEKTTNWKLGDIAVEVERRHEELMVKNPKTTLLKEFLENTGALSGMAPAQAQAVCVDLVWEVRLIVTEAVDRNLEELTGRPSQLSCP